jgi:hypothetical protein
MDPIPAVAAPTTLLRIEYTPTQAEFVEACLYPFRAKRLRGMLLLVIGALIFIGLGVLNSPTWSSWYFVVSVGLIVSALMNPYVARRALVDYFRQHPQLSQTTIATYSAEGVFVQTQSVDILVRWHAFTHFAESRRFFFLHRGPGNPLFLAKRVFATPPELDDYRALLVQYIGRTSMASQQGFPVSPAESRPQSV